LDLKYKQKVTFRESVIGKDISIPHFDGPIKLNTRKFGILNPSITYTLPKKGLCGQGSLSVSFDIEYPTDPLTETQLESLAKVL